MLATVTSLETPQPAATVVERGTDYLVDALTATETLAGSIAAGVIFILVGLLVLVFGSRLVKAGLFVAGGSILAYVTWQVLIAIQGTNEWPSEDVIYIVAAVAAFLIGGALALWLYWVGLFLLGAMVGWLLGLALLAALVTVLDSQVARIIIIVVSSVLGGILMVKFEKTLLAIATSIVGAAYTVIGVDVFVKSGLLATSIRLLQEGKVEDGIRQPAAFWGLLAAFVGLAIIGSIVQIRFTRRKD